MSTPLPGWRVRGSATGRPIMALLDLLGRRMAGRVLWELRDRHLTFRALQQAAETNPSVLNARLKELREARIVGHGPEGYGLTPHGKALLAAFLPLHAWAEDWAKALGVRSSAPAKAGADTVAPTGDAATVSDPQGLTPARAPRSARRSRGRRWPPPPARSRKADRGG